MTLTLAIVVLFTEVWLLAHGRGLAAAAFGILALAVVLFLARRERRG